MTDQEFYNRYGFWLNPPPPPPFAQWKQPMNSRGLSSYEQARALVKAINAHQIDFGNGTLRPMGGGVLPGDDEEQQAIGRETGFENKAAGIYVPAWLPGPGGFRQPAVEDAGVKYWSLHLRFKNGNAGMNVGLFLDKLSRFPLSQAYVVRYLAQEAEQVL